MKLFLNRLLHPGCSRAQRHLNARIRAAVEAWVLDKGYVRPLKSVEEIAADIGIPADLLCPYIHLESGKTLLTWRKDLRMAEAKRLLRDFPELPLSMVGKLVGIDDKSNFRRQFAETTGLTPLQWRARFRR